MPNHFAEALAGSRRLFILRFLFEVGTQANESVIFSAVGRGGFALATRDELRGDLDHLKAQGCTSDEWFGGVRVAKLTERGEDVAHGRVEAGGVEHSHWYR